MQSTDRPVRAWGPVAVSRIALVVLATIAVPAGAPTGLIAPLWLLALVLVAERLVRLRARGATDALLVATGGILIALILIGLALGVTRIGLRAPAWAIALGVVSVLALALVEQFAPGSRRRPDWLRVYSWAHPIWALASTAVVVLALAVSVRATNRADVAPVQMSFGPISASSVQVVVSTDRPTGPLELNTQGADGTSLSYPVFSVEPGHPVSTSLVLPASGRFTVTLNNPDQSAPLRSLILDR